jgi:subtilisin-like proprotein convertase family protein
MACAHLLIAVVVTIDIRVVLVSPTGTKSVLAVQHGDRHAHYTGWTFTSVRHWGENPKGSWKLILSDEAAGNVGTRPNLSQFPPSQLLRRSVASR